MRHPFLLLLLSCAPAAAQSGDRVTQMLVQGLEHTIAGITRVPEVEQRMVVGECAKLLQRSVSFRPDGTAASIDRGLGRNVHIEWRKLAIKSVNKSPLSAADRANGISRSYLAVLGCEASRTWNQKANAWSDWHNSGYLLFPSAIIVKEINGAIVTSAPRIETFSPGGGGNSPQGGPPGIYRRSKDGTLRPVK